MEESLKRIPLLEVLKNGSVLKNIFVITKSPSDSVVSSPKSICKEEIEDSDEALGSIFIAGRHPECDIVLTHPSISRHHFQIDSDSSREKFIVTDLKSVHGTWISGKKLHPGSSKELHEGDTIEVGSSTRTYRLHWVPLRSAYGTQNQFIGENPVLEDDDTNTSTENEDGEAEMSKSITESEGHSAIQMCEEMEAEVFFENHQEQRMDSPYPSSGEESKHCFMILLFGDDLVESHSNLVQRSSLISSESVNSSSPCISQSDNHGNCLVPCYKEPENRGIMFQGGDLNGDLKPPGVGVGDLSLGETTDTETMYVGATGMQGDEGFGASHATPVAEEFINGGCEKREVASENFTENEEEDAVLCPDLAFEMPMGHEPEKGQISDHQENEQFLSCGEGMGPTETNAASTWIHNGNEMVDDTEQKTPPKDAIANALPQKGLFHATREDHATYITPPMSSLKNISWGPKALKSFQSPSIMASSPSKYISSDKENKTPIRSEYQHSKNQTRQRGSKTKKEKSERVPLQALNVNCTVAALSEDTVPKSKTRNITDISYPEVLKASDPHDQKPSENLVSERKRWAMVVDTSSLLDQKSRRSLQLLQGLKETYLIIPRMVIRELDCLKRNGGIFSRKREACLVLEWIEECMAKADGWIHVQSAAETGQPVVPTPLVSPRPLACDGENRVSPRGVLSWPKLGLGFSPSIEEVAYPAVEDHVLECALSARQSSCGGHVVLLTQDITLMIKAMAEGLICESAQRFRDSLVNPFSERFLWSESLARGNTWSILDDFVLKENYYITPRKNNSKKKDNTEGLKLVLLTRDS